MATLLRDTGWTDWMRRTLTATGRGTELGPAAARCFRRPARLVPNVRAAVERRGRFKIESTTD